MNRGIILKSIRETWVTTLLCCLGLILFQVILAIALPYIWQDRMGQVPEIAQSFIRGLLGDEYRDQLTKLGLASIVWVHPIMLSLIFAHIITCSTRVPAGETDRCTIDILLSLPISRWKIFLSESAVAGVSGLLLVTVAVVSNWLSGSISGVGFQPSLGKLCVVGVNLYVLYVAVGGISALFSSLCESRGRPVAFVISIVLVSMLISFLAQFWRQLEFLNCLSFLSYHEPLPIIVHGTIPWANIITLLVVGFVTWAAAGEVFHRRDIHTL